VFDNIALIVPLDPGSIGNSQVIYEDEDPAPFTSVASASGNGALAYQWQETLTPGTGGSWTDIPGATGETYAFPNQYGVYPDDTTIYARRKVTDAYYTEYSNEVSLQIKKVFDTSGAYLFVDNFNTIDTTDANWDYETRQADGGGTSPYTYYAGHYSIANSKLKNAGFAGFLSLDANMARYIVGEDFELSFKVSVLDTTGNWTSIYLQDETNTSDPRDDSRFGMYLLGSGNADWIGGVYKGAGPGHDEEGVAVSEMEALTGVPYNKADEHTFTLISHAGPGESNTYDLVIDGYTMRTNLPYYFDGAERRIGIVGVMDAASPGAYYDDITLRYLPTYTRWSEENGLVGADALRDADIENGGLGDGMDNLLEYALGGDPNVDDAATVLPTYGITEAGGGSNFVDYIYNRRFNAASLGLTYGLNTSTNLMSAWEYVGTAYETDSIGIDQDFESVSNSVPFDTDEGFIQLKVSED